MAELIITAGDCEFHGRCACGHPFGSIRPNQSLDVLGQKWDLHVNTGQCPLPQEDL